MNKTNLVADIDSAAARAQAFSGMPVTIVPLSHIRDQIRAAEIDIAESTMRRDGLRLILEIREKQERKRTLEILEKCYLPLNKDQA